MPITLDIGGEGGHPGAVNLNPARYKTLGPERGRPIPRLIVGRADAIPFADKSVSQVIVERTPLSRQALAEIARVVAPGGVVFLTHVPLPAADRHALARAMDQRPRDANRAANRRPTRARNADRCAGTPRARIALICGNKCLTSGGRFYLLHHDRPSLTLETQLKRRLTAFLFAPIPRCEVAVKRRFFLPIRRRRALAPDVAAAH